MSMDPSKWIPFDRLADTTRQRIETVYPYLKLEQCLFQDKESGVFMKAINNVKIEKLLNPLRAGAELEARPEAKPAAKIASGGSRGKK